MSATAAPATAPRAAHTPVTTTRAAHASWLLQTWLVTRRWVTNSLRQPWGFGVTVIQPVIWIVLFGNVFKAVAQVPGFGTADYLTFLVPGILMMTMLYSGAWAGTGFIDDIKSGVMDRLLSSPVSRPALVAGQLVQQLLTSLLQGVVLLLIGWAAGARYAGGPGGMALALVAALLLAAAFCSVSAAVALTARDQTALIGVSTIIVLPATFLSVALMPVTLLPHWVEAVSRCNPLTWATQIARTALSPQVDGGILASRGGMLLALAAVTYLWSVAAMRRYQRSL
ncbi:MAG: ABC transporter permease [Micrococcales bacterium]|nr:ABC transporter permease [Micrococcales bacterium]